MKPKSAKAKSNDKLDIASNRNPFLEKLGKSNTAKGIIAIVTVLGFALTQFGALVYYTSMAVNRHLSAESAQDSGSVFMHDYMIWESAHNEEFAMNKLGLSLNRISKTNEAIGKCIDRHDFDGIRDNILMQDANIVLAYSGVTLLVEQGNGESRLIHRLDEACARLTDEDMQRTSNRLLVLLREANLQNQGMCNLTRDYLETETRMNEIMRDYVSGSHDEKMTAMLIYDLCRDKEKILDRRYVKENELKRTTSQARDEWHKLKARLECLK